MTHIRTHSFVKPVIEQSSILFIDMQERLLKAMPDSLELTILKQIILLKAAKLLGLDVIITEQYPKGLGHTDRVLKEHFSVSWPIIEKSTFSCMAEIAVRKELQRKPKNTLILVGIESHVCVLQTAIDAIDQGYNVILLKDAVNSRNSIDYEMSFETAKSAGVFIMTVESLLFMLMVDSKHSAFRDVSKLLR